MNLATDVTEEALDEAADEATVGLDDTTRHGLGRMHKFIEAPGTAVIVDGTREICANPSGNSPFCLANCPPSMG